MSGCKAGLCTLIKSQLSPKAVYIHCYAHRLNLALESSCTKIVACQKMIKTAQNLYAYVEGSAKQHHLFHHIQGPSIQIALKELCATRWHHRFRSLKAIKKTFSSLLTFFSIQNEEVTASCSIKASALFSEIKNISFVFHLELLYNCFKCTNHLSELLQTEDLDIMQVQTLFMCAVKTLTKMKSDEAYLEFFDIVMKIVSSNSIEAETKHGNKRGRRHSIEMSKNDEFKVKYLTIIDTLIGELEFRFKEENIRPLTMIYKVITAPVLDHFINIKEELKIYESDIDFDLLELDLTVWQEYKAQNAQYFNGGSRSICNQFINCNLHKILKELYKLFLIYLSIPISSASGERSFTVLKLLKTYLRNSMIQQRVSNLAVIKINSDLLKEIKIDEVINIFASLKDRRVKFSY